MELKLLVDPDERSLIERYPAFRGAKPRTRHAVTTYYDTKDLALYRMGACLRVRRSGRSFVQTVKLDRADDRMGTRGEWEWSLPSAEPDLGKLQSLPEEASAIRAVVHAVQALFATHVRRKSWQLDLEEGTIVEAVMDLGTIEAGTKSLEISEVELELKQGSPAAVYRLAMDLTECTRLRFGSQSKSQRGYGLVSDNLPDRPDGALPPWDAGVLIGTVFPTLIHAALRELAAEIPSVSEGAVEGVHRMRAAIRKLRSVLALFEPYLERRAARGFKASLREIGAVLGRGRDWDVFLTETLPRAEAGAFGAEAARMRDLAEAQRADAHAAILEAMKGRPLTALVLGMAAWTVETRWIRKTNAAAPFAELVPALLDDLDRKARKRARKLDMDDVEELHDLRKCLKKLRYSIDYVGSLFDGEKVAAYLHTIKDALGALGDINDAAVTRHRVEDLMPTDSPHLASASAAVLREADRRCAKALGKLPKKLHHFQIMEPFWR